MRHNCARTTFQTSLILAGALSAGADAAAGEFQAPDIWLQAPRCYDWFGVGADNDRDDLSDECEDQLIQMYAPLAYIKGGETHLPANIDWILVNAELWMGSQACEYGWIVLESGDVTQSTLLAQQEPEMGNACEFQGDMCVSYRRCDSAGEEYYFHFPSESLGGSVNSGDWIVYAHAYPVTDAVGVRLDYWFFYPYSDQVIFEHEGDWEMMSVTLGRDLLPADVSYRAHGQLLGPYERSDIDWFEGTHPIDVVGRGSHASYRSRQDCLDARTHGLPTEPGDCPFMRDDERWFTWDRIWQGGYAGHWEAYTRSGAGAQGGGTINVGEYSQPDYGYGLHALNAQDFIGFAGAWGASADSPIGPAFKDYWYVARSIYPLYDRPSGLLDFWTDVNAVYGWACNNYSYWNGSSWLLDTYPIEVSIGIGEEAVTVMANLPMTPIEYLETRVCPADSAGNGHEFLLSIPWDVRYRLGPGDHAVSVAATIWGHEMAGQSAYATITDPTPELIAAVSAL